MTRPSPHIVQVGWDADLLRQGAGSDAIQRQAMYLRLMRERDAAAHSTVVILGAPVAAGPVTIKGVDVIPVPGRWKGVITLGKVLTMLHRDRPITQLAAQSVFEEGWATLAFGRRQRIPVLAQMHFDIFDRNAAIGGNLLRRLAGASRQRIALGLLPRYQAIRTVSPAMTEGARAAGATAIRCLPVAVTDLLRFDVSPTRTGPVVLFIGRLVPFKNVPLFIDVVERLKRDIPEIRAEIIGDGPLHRELADMIHQRKLHDVITMVGEVSRAELPARLSRASVMLSTSNHEGFGRVLIEAMIAGLPIVSTRTTGPLSVLDDGRWGRLAPVGDADALARETTILVKNPVEAADLANAAKAHALQTYAPDTLARQWVDMLISASLETGPNE
jgi:glycosyltransferase involved in cell wall biosynthesis